MLETVGSTLQDVVRNVRIVDILDIALISAVFYLLLNWLIQSLSRRTLFGFLTLFVIYAFARITDMYLTELLIQAFFIVILIGLVVVFQSDIRRIVDRIGNWRFFNKEQGSTYSHTATDILTEAVSKMADNKTGALIVIRGKEEWERHIDGGIELNGTVQHWDGELTIKFNNAILMAVLNLMVSSPSQCCTVFLIRHLRGTTGPSCWKAVRSNNLVFICHCQKTSARALPEAHGMPQPWEFQNIVMPS